MGQRLSRPLRLLGKLTIIQQRDILHQEQHEDLQRPSERRYSNFSIIKVGDAGNKYSEITHALIGEICMDKSKAVP